LGYAIYNPKGAWPNELLWFSPTKIFFNTLIQDENSKRYGCYLYGNFRGFKITLKGVEKYAILDLK